MAVIEKEDKDELEALDALEKEASEFNKVQFSNALLRRSQSDLLKRMPKSTAYSRPSN